jgi:hypothetical protein
MFSAEEEQRGGVDMKEEGKKKVLRKMERVRIDI